MIDHARDVAAVKALLGSLDDWARSTVKTTSGMIVARSAQPGEAATSKVECDACGGTGRRRIRRVVQTCDRCNGKGWRAVDAYTGREGAGNPAYALDKGGAAELLRQIRDDIDLRDSDPGSRGDVNHAAKVRNEATLWALEARQRVRNGAEASSDPLTAAHDARTRQYELGDYDELEWALASLLRVSVDWHEAVRVVFVDRDIRVVGPRLEQSAEAACSWLAREIRAAIGSRPIRVPAWAVREQSPLVRVALLRVKGRNQHDDLSQRNRMIREVFESGECDIPAIIRLTGLSRSQVSEIVYGAAS